MKELDLILKNIKNKEVLPIYFFHGEEPYFIDVAVKALEHDFLEEDEKAFNQTVTYGKDTTYQEILSLARQFPMMGDKQVIIVKEAQDLRLNEEENRILESYVENPMQTTVLVFCYKYKTLDKRKKVTKLLAQNGIVYESKKLYENQVGDWIKRVLSGKGYSIEPKANAMLVEFLGTDLSKINNELEKLQIILPKGTAITPTHIEENIGFSKDYNVFELRKAIGERNQIKAYKIAENFAHNPKDYPIVMTTGLIFGFFIQLLKYHGLKDKNPKNVATAIGVNPYFLKEYDLAIKNYPMRKVSQVVSALRDIDVKSKGVGANALPQSDLLKEMLYKIFN